MKFGIIDLSKLNEEDQESIAIVGFIAGLLTIVGLVWLIHDLIKNTVYMKLF